MLVSLLSVPATPEDWALWSFAHAQDHIEIIQAIVKDSGPQLIQYQLDPIPFQDKTDWEQRHLQSHLDMENVLGVQSTDLNDFNIKDPKKLQEWIYNNYQEHFDARSVLRI